LRERIDESHPRHKRTQPCDSGSDTPLELPLKNYSSSDATAVSKT
jgi:hypothetical protein